MPPLLFQKDQDLVLLLDLKIMSAQKLVISFQLLVFSLIFLIFTTSLQAASSSQPLIPDEQAVYNLNQNLLAPEAIKDIPADQSLLGKITSTVTSFFSKVSQIFNPQKLFAQSESIHQVQTPSEAQSKETNPANIFESFLGGKTGVYSISLPEGIGKTSDKIIDKEKQFQQANFPPGISPITGQ